MNNKILTGLSIALTICVIVLFSIVLKTQNQPNNSVRPISQLSDSGAVQNITVAYINMDSLLAKYEYYLKLGEEQASKQMQAEEKLNSKMKKLESDYYSLQEKAQKGLMTRSEAAEAEQSMQARQQELMQLQQKMSNDLLQEEQKLQKMLADTVVGVINEFNKTAGYNIIMNNVYGSTILYADNSMNITDTILSILNSRFREHIENK